MSKGTARRTVRIDDELWEAAKEQAESEGIDLSVLVRRLLRDWLKPTETNVAKQ